MRQEHVRGQEEDTVTVSESSFCLKEIDSKDDVMKNLNELRNFCNVAPKNILSGNRITKETFRLEKSC